LLRQAQAENQTRKNVGSSSTPTGSIAETERTLRKLAEAQLPDGAWSWFPASRHDYTQLYITTGFAASPSRRGTAMDAAIRSLQRLDG